MNNVVLTQTRGRFAFLAVLLVMFFAVLVLLTSGGSSGEKTWYVDDDGADFETIQDAVNASENGDTIYVWEGTYYENVVVNKSVSLIGNGSEVTIIYGGGEGDVVRITADWCNMSGFTMRNGSSESWKAGLLVESDHNRIFDNECTSALYGISLWESNGNVLKNNTCNGNEYRGISLSGSSDNVLMNNNCFYNGQYGIDLYYQCNNNTLTNNSCLYNSEYGIHLDGSGNVLACNSFSSNYGGIWFSSASNNLLHNNTCSYNEAIGINIDWECNYNKIKDNLCSYNNGTGIGVCESSNYNLLEGNLISNNDYGITLTIANRNLLANNTISRNRIGIRVTMNSKDNAAHYNDISSNGEYGISVTKNDGYTINATDNWWGDDSGPYHPEKNPDGKGDNVTDGVKFDPWTGKKAGPVYIWVETDKDAYEKGGGVEITLVLVNEMDEWANYSFGSTHQTDIIIYDSFGEEVFREPEEGLDWPAVITNISVEANSETTIETYTWDQRDSDGNSVEYGNYRIYATLVGYEVDGEKQIMITEATHVWAEAPDGGDGSRERPFNKIQDAINASGESALIRVWEGTYYENVVIDKTVSLIGNGSDVVTIDGGGEGDVVSITADEVEMSGFTIVGSGKKTGGVGIQINSNHNRISSINCSNYCRILVEGSYNRIYENTCNGSGIQIKQGKYNILDKNVCTFSGTGILVSRGTEYNFITNNTCSFNFEEGISIYQSDHNTIINNICNWNKLKGIELWANHNKVLNNICSRNNYSGIHLEDADYNVVDGNTCLENWGGNYPYGSGISLTESRNNVFTSNTLSKNPIGISAGEFLENNEIHNNKIFNNTVFGIKSSDIATYIINATHNYWGSNSGPFHPTKNPNGTGDNVSDFVDFKPWLNEDGTVNESSAGDEGPDDPTTTPGEEDLRFILFIGLVGLALVFGIAVAASEILRFFLLSLLLPLYTRLSGKDIEDDIRQHSIRGRIYQYIEDNPGINFSGIVKRISAGNGTTTYHLSVLEREGFIKAASNGNYKLFWARREFPGVPDAIVTEVQKEILMLLEKHGTMSRKELLEKTGISKSTLHFNIKQLVMGGRIREEKKGKEHYCSLK